MWKANQQFRRTRACLTRFEAAMPLAIRGGRPGEGRIGFMADFCAFCGAVGPLTREHVFGQWVSKIGLDLTPTRHYAGPLNSLPRHMGKQPPYRQTVKSFCASCNNGWMSNLETAAKRVLTPLILDEPGTIALEDQAVIATWVHKTALTAMLLSSQEQRESGYGLSPLEYRALYERRELRRPLNASQFWVGRFEGASGFSAVRVTPLTVRSPGLPECRLPQGYAMTIVLGALILHGLRFTALGLQANATMELGMPQLWPSDASLSWPTGKPCTGQSFLALADGGTLRMAGGVVQLQPWTQAAHLPQSTFKNGMVKVPALCRKHEVYYPAALLREAQQGRFYAFMTACACTAYLMQTDSDRVRFRGAGEPEEITAMYADLTGDEVLIQDHAGDFACMRLSL